MRAVQTAGDSLCVGSRSVGGRSVLLLCLCAAAGCWAPLHSRGIPAPELPDTFRMPMRAHVPELILSSLAQDVPRDYVLGPGDVLEVTIPELFPRDEVRPMRVQVVGDGTVQLPLVGGVAVGGKTLSQAQQLVTETYADGFLVDPRVSIILVQRGGTDVVVLGFVNRPGAYPLPRFENDISHAIAAAGGLRDDAGDIIEVHRRAVPVLPADEPPPPLPGPEIELQSGWSLDEAPPWSETADYVCPYPSSLPVGTGFVLRIPLKGDLTPTVTTPDGVIRPVALAPEDVVLRSGDVVRVPKKVDEVFYVVGPLSPANFVRFTVRDQDREVGAGFLLPENRDIDVVTAVTMAGYIDPINSPTTVTVHRMRAGQAPLLILVDLIKARYNPQENIYVEAGDIIYLNPDAPWYFRRLFDRMIDTGLRVPYERAIRRSIDR